MSETAVPSMASEDFACVLDEVPGALVFVGAAADGGSVALHSERAVFEDSILDLQAQVFAEPAWRCLHAGRRHRGSSSPATRRPPDRCPSSIALRRSRHPTRGHE